MICLTASRCIQWLGLAWAFGAALSVDAGRLGGFVILALAFVLSWFTLVIHELGHLIMGLVVGIKVLRFHVGPLAFLTAPRRIKFFQPAYRPDVGGAVHFRNSKTTSRLGWALVGIAGPALDLLVAIVLGFCAETIATGMAIKPLLIFAAVWSASHALANLMPFDGSDGSLVLFGPNRLLEPPPCLL